MNGKFDIFVLLVCVLCLSTWLSFFKRAGKRWRFEFFTLDFGLGALLLSAVAAFTLGNFEGELGLADRVLVASKTSQALAVSAGFLFGLGFLSLFAAVRLTGIACASLISFSLAALIAASVTLTSGNLLFSAASLALLFAATLLGAKAARGQDSPLPPLKNQRQPTPVRLRVSSKGILLALASGLFFGGAVPVASSSISGDFGLAPYAGILAISLGLLVSAGVFSFFFIHITIDQPPTTLRVYWSRSGANRGQARYGLFSGFLCAAGALAYFVARGGESAADNRQLAPIHNPNLAAIAALIFATLSGILFWNESSLTKSRGALFGALLLFSAGMLCSALAGSL